MQFQGIRVVVIGGMLGIAAVTQAASPIVTGAGSASTHLKRFDPLTLTETASFFAYPAASGGVRVAAGDVTGDGVAEIVTGPGSGSGPQVNVFDGVTLAAKASFFAYTPSYAGGIFVAAGDVTGDGRADIVTGTDEGVGGGHVKVFDGATLAEVRSFFAFPTTFAGGVRVAAGDVNGDGHADVIVGAGPGGGPEVSLFDGATGALRTSFFAYDPRFAGGVYVAAGDITGDGVADVITGADAGAGPQVKVFDGVTLAEVRSFFAFSPSFAGGVRVAAGDVNGDGRDDIIVGAGAGGGPQVEAFSGVDNSVLRSFFAYDAGFTGGVFVAGASVLPEPSGIAAVVGAAGAVLGQRRRRLTK